MICMMSMAVWNHRVVLHAIDATTPDALVDLRTGRVARVALANAVWLTLVSPQGSDDSAISDSGRCLFS